MTKLKAKTQLSYSLGSRNFFSYGENGALNRVLKLAEHLTCMNVASNFIILITMCEPNKRIEYLNMSRIGIEQSALIPFS